MLNFGLCEEELAQIKLLHSRVIDHFMMGETDSALEILQFLATTFERDFSFHAESNKLKEEFLQMNKALNLPFLLSKTTYMKGCQCVKAIYLNKHSPTLRDKPSKQALEAFQNGHNFEDNIRSALYSDGVDVEKILGPRRKYYPFLTSLLVARGVQTIFEAGFILNKTLVLIDILHKGSEGWQLIEIKNSSYPREQYIDDASLQFYVASGHIPISNVKLLLHRDEEPYLVDITSEVHKRQPPIKDRIQQFCDLLEQGQVPEIPIGPYCQKPYRCDFYGHCHSNGNPIT